MDQKPKNSRTKVVFKGNFVTLRSREGVKGKSLYLDYTINGERQYEFLRGLELKAKNDKQKNKLNLETAIGICQKTDIRIQSEEYDFVPAFTSKVDFMMYFEKYIEEYKRRDKRMFISSKNQFENFLKEQGIAILQGSNVTEKLIFRFADYLQSNSSLHGETPHSYFKRFKKVLKQAHKEKIIRTDVGHSISMKVNDSVTKDVLSMEEISKLAHTKCPNDDVGRAFIFSCVTGLRYDDVKDLTWSNIKDDTCKIIQGKTGKEHSVLLNNTATRMIGERGLDNQKIFRLPSFHTCLKTLKTWKNNAGIDKHVTWHVSRHSFATNLLINDTDIKTTAGLLGHSGLKHVDRYVRLVKSLQERAVNKLEISI